MTVAIIDGDSMCYQCFPPRWVSKAKELSLDDNGKLVSKDIVELDDLGNYIVPEFTEEEDLQYLETGWRNFKANHRKILDALWTNDYLMAVKGANNYRDLLYPDYKLKRGQVSKPSPWTVSRKFVPSIRKRLVKEDMAIHAHGRESDDYIRIWAEQCIYLKKDYVIVREDKDLACIPGKHYLLHKNLKDEERMIVVTPEDAKALYYKQILMGDTTDNIPGVPGLGPKTADKLLAGLTTDEEYQEVVVEAYFNKYGPETWLEYLASNSKMIHIQTHLNDYCDLMQWPIVRELI